MDHYAILGYPLGHSISPKIHNAGIQYYSLDANYSKIEIPPDDFNTTIDDLKSNPEYKGFNVTIPFKERIFAFLDEIDPLAKKIGAANTIKRLHSGIWKGFNTDAKGFMAPIKENLENIKNLLIIGAGGASRAISFALCEFLKDPNLTLINRTLHRAEELADHLKKYYSHNVKTGVWDDFKADRSFDLIVNTTSMGMGNTTLEIPVDWWKYIHQKTIVYDIVYNPPETPFLKQGKKHGLKTINGLPMLFGQAEASFQTWFDKKYPHHLLENITV